MALTKIETKRVERAMEEFLAKRRPPGVLRDQVDLSYRISGQSVEIFEVRADWRDPERKLERPVAKATYARTTDRWRIYWLRADGKWHAYEPVSEVGTVEVFLEVVAQDRLGCFFG